MSTHIMIGTRKGLFVARREDDPGAASSWQAEGPMFLMQEIAAVGVVPGSAATGSVSPQSGPRLLAGVRSEHWGPGVSWSDDLGRTWQETDEGAIRFPEDTGAALARVWQLQADQARPGVVWAGCEPTSLWRSDDGGVTFEFNRSLWNHPHRPHWAPGAGGAAVHSVVTDPGDASKILIAMSTGGVYLSDDAGASWRPSNTGISAYFLPDPQPEFGQCVHKVAMDAAGPRTLYAQNHHGVYRSDDGAASWTSIADGLPSDFGFVMLAHPHRSGTAWVVPLEADARRVPPKGRLRVHRTLDGGITWAESSSGLPDDDWTVVLRDAACVVDRGSDRPPLVVIGTRDGCVYASDDEGDSFVLVADHLPDVLTVRGVEIS